ARPPGKNSTAPAKGMPLHSRTGAAKPTTTPPPATTQRTRTEDAADTSRCRSHAVPPTSTRSGSPARKPAPPAVAVCPLPAAPAAAAVQSQSPQPSATSSRAHHPKRTHSQLPTHNSQLSLSYREDMQSLSFTPGRAFLSSNSPTVPWTAVFEDEGIAGYFYA